MLEYRDVADFPGYRVGNDGTVWTTRLRNGAPGNVWRQLRLRRIGRYGHLAVTLYGATIRQVQIHTLVLEAFISPCPPGLECCHKDSNPTNNAIDNLRWGTHASNVQDSIQHGTFPRGEKSPRAKISLATVTSIRTRFTAGETISQLAADTGLSWCAVNDIVKRRTWKHV